MSDQNDKPISSASQKVFSDPRLLREIMSYLNDGRAANLISCLPVSKDFFHASATSLCRRIEVPIYEFSTTKVRDQTLSVADCVSCYGEEPKWSVYHRPYNATAHRAMNPELSRHYLAFHHASLRHIHPSTEVMRMMYRHVHVVSVEEHAGCDRLAIQHPLPLVRTVIMRGGHAEVCAPAKSKPGAVCGFLPQYPFRLVLDGLCNSMLCIYCTSDRIFSPHVETLVLRIRYELHDYACKAKVLPDHSKPTRLVLYFPPEASNVQFDNIHYFLYRNDDHLMAYAPGQGQMVGSNTFYQMAKMCMAMSEECKIYIVGADHGALHFHRLDYHDSTLESFPPINSRGNPTNDDRQLERPQRIPGSDYNEWLIEEYERQLRREQYDEDDERRHRIPTPTPIQPVYQYPCYNKLGQIVSARHPRGAIPRQAHEKARREINKRVTILQKLLRRWIDFLYDSQLPLPKWEEVEAKGDPRTKEEFENDLNELTRQKNRDGNPDFPDIDPDLNANSNAMNRDAIEERRRICHRNIKFITLHQYHQLEGNNDELDDPSRYL